MGACIRGEFLCRSRGMQERAPVHFGFIWHHGIPFLSSSDFSAWVDVTSWVLGTFVAVFRVLDIDCVDANVAEKGNARSR
eukprot:2743051-Pyramimonas_sp.AAC.1